MDGYHLRMHRIPYSPVNNNSTSNISQAVLMVHGLSASAGQYAIHPNKSMATILSDGGYDVWMLNVRGISYSLKKNRNALYYSNFWDYSFHEHGYFDLPSAVDHILQVTGNKNVHYIGHSQGGSNLLVMLSTRPEYNLKIASAYLLTPGAFVSLTDGAKVLLRVRQLMAILRFHYIQLRNPLLEEVAEFFCKYFNSLCSTLISSIIGPNDPDLDQVRKQLYYFREHQ